MAMNALKGLVFAPLPKTTGSDPTIQRRQKLIERLNYQIQLANDPSFRIPRQKWVSGENGKELRDMPKKVTPWWRMTSNGEIVLVVRYGAHAIELEKGKAAIAVGPKEKLVPTIEAVIEAVREGSLDAILAQMSKTAVQTKGKKAA